MGFSRQEFWSGLPFPPPEDLPEPGIEPMSHASPALTTGLPGKPTDFYLLTLYCILQHSLINLLVLNVFVCVCVWNL